MKRSVWIGLAVLCVTPLALCTKSDDCKDQNEQKVQCPQSQGTGHGGYLARSFASGTSNGAGEAAISRGGFGLAGAAHGASGHGGGGT